MGLPIKTYEWYDNSGGVDLKSSPTKGYEDEASDCQNVDYSIDGAFFSRNGSTIVNTSSSIPAQMSGAPRTLAMFDYKKSDGTQVQIICAGTTIKHSLSSPTDAVTGLSAALPIPDIEFQVTADDEYAFWGNGVDTNLKFDGTTWTNWSIAAPSSASVAADNGVGTISAGAYTYYVTFARTVAGVIVQESDLSDVSNSLTIAANRQILISSIPVSSDPQVNARVLYRSKNGATASRVTSGATITDNVTTTYSDNTDSISANATVETDNQPAPTSAIFEEYQGCMNIVDANRSTDVYESKVNKPWNVPSTNFEIFDGPVQCQKRIYGVLFTATDKSMWVREGRLADGNVSRRVSSLLGVLNNRCAVGNGPLYVMATNKKFYQLSPTDFANNEIRIEAPLSIKIEPIINNISDSLSDYVSMEYYTKADVAKVMIAAPIGTNTNNAIIVYNETQSILKDKPVWSPWSNINASAMKQFNINGNIALYSGDYNGFIWKIDDTARHGDGAEVNGTASSGSTTTLTDNTQSWTVNAYVGMTLRALSGTGVDQYATITSNTSTQLTFAAVGVAFDNTTVYTIGGYNAYHFTNWKSVTGSYDALKQLWYFISNLNASGSYSINLIIQYDFDTTVANSVIIPITLTASNNSIWGDFLWGGALWGAQSVFQDRIRVYGRFRAVRFGFQNKEAGQPFQVNGMSATVQDKGLFYGAAA